MVEAASRCGEPQSQSSPYRGVGGHNPWTLRLSDASGGPLMCRHAVRDGAGGCSVAVYA